MEAFRPDPSRFDAAGRSSEWRPSATGSSHEVRSLHDPQARTVHIRHILRVGTDEEAYEVTLTYASERQLDEMAAAARLRLRRRWNDWTGAPADNSSTDPISVYVLIRPKP